MLLVGINCIENFYQDKVGRKPMFRKVYKALSVMLIQGHVELRLQLCFDDTGHLLDAVIASLCGIECIDGEKLPVDRP